MERAKEFQIVGSGKRQTPILIRPPRWRQLPILSFVILGLIVCGCLAAPWLANHDPTQFYLTSLNQAPNGEFYFGTDALGRDIFSIIWYGGRVSLVVGFLGMAIATVIGIVYGCLSGTGSAALDMLLMRLAELISSIPSLLLMLLLLACIHAPNIWTISLVIGVTNWMNLARIVRGEVRQIRNSDYVLASKTMGGSFLHIVWYHLLPNFLSPIMFMVVSSIGTSMMMESTLSFLGIGLPVEVVSWGSMLSLATQAVLTNAWWVILVPGAFLVVTLFCITQIGHYLRHHVNRGSSNL